MMIKKIKNLAFSVVSETPILVWMLLASALLHFFLIFALSPEVPKPKGSSLPKVVFKINLEQDISDTVPSLEEPKSSQIDLPSNNQASIPSKDDLALMPVSPQLLPKFYKARELDILPKPIGEVPLKYPSTVKDVLQSGTVRLEIFIDDNGDVLSLNVIDATLPGVFDQAAIDAFKNQRFEPGMLNEKPVKSYIKMTVGFGQNTLGR